MTLDVSREFDVTLMMREPDSEMIVKSSEYNNNTNIGCYRFFSIPKRLEFSYNRIIIKNILCNIIKFSSSYLFRTVNEKSSNKI